MVIIDHAEELKIKFGLNDALWATFKAVMTQLKTILLQEVDNDTIKFKSIDPWA